MAYVRPTNPIALTAAAKTEMLRQYWEFYQEIAHCNPAELNRKLPRSAVDVSLDRIGALIREEARALAEDNADIRLFLADNIVPAMMAGLLPDNFRVFCLLLNALKQWVSAEQAATDRWLLGGTAKERCRKMATACLVTGEPLTADIDLHHPVRDGRPPLPLSKTGHRIIERQTAANATEDDPGMQDTARAIAGIKKPSQSWSMLRRGCRLLLGLPPGGGTPSSNASAKSFARRTVTNSGRTAQELLDWLDEKRLGSGKMP